MIQCQNCGQTNGYGSNFCRFCGTRMIMPQKIQPLQEEYSQQPRPYSWKTDEFQVKENPARKTQDIRQVQPIPQQAAMNPQMPQAIDYRQPAYFTGGYRCPRCATQNLPYIKRQISTAGWIVFGILLVTTGIFFWIGLLIREDVKICSVCNLKIT